MTRRQWDGLAVGDVLRTRGRQLRPVLGVSSLVKYGKTRTYAIVRKLRQSWTHPCVMTCIDYYTARDSGMVATTRKMVIHRRMQRCPRHGYEHVDVRGAR